MAHKRTLDITVVIPTFNRADLLKLAILSALRQKKVKIEVIVADDCSTDNTKHVVKSLKDKRVRYYKNKSRLGTSHNMQRHFLKSKGEYIFTLGDDDLILENDALYEIKNQMKKYKAGFGKIGSFGYEEDILRPYQAFVLNRKSVFYKPSKSATLLIRSIDFGLGFYSGLIFHNKRMNKNLLIFDHKCFPDHMCQVYHKAAFDLIQRYGILYIANKHIVARLSLNLIPRYFNMKWHGRLFMEDHMIPAADFLNPRGYAKFKQAFIAKQLGLIPNIKYFSSTGNTLAVIRRMTQINPQLTKSGIFWIYSATALLPKFLISLFRDVAIRLKSKEVNQLVIDSGYKQKIQALLLESKD